MIELYLYDQDYINYCNAFGIGISQWRFTVPVRVIEGVPWSLLRENKDKVDWKYLSGHVRLSEDFVREFKDMLDWYRLCSWQDFTRDFLYEFAHRVHWGESTINFVTGYPNGTWVDFRDEKAIRILHLFKDRLNWKVISFLTDFPLDLLEEHTDYVYWTLVSRHHSLSKEFLTQFKDRLNPREIRTRLLLYPELKIYYP